MSRRRSSRSARALALAALSAGAWLGCDTGFVSIGWDDPVAHECVPTDCGAEPDRSPLCPELLMGSFDCALDPLTGECNWRTVCSVSTCAEPDCGLPPDPGRMCLGGTVREWSCEPDGESCVWSLYECPNGP